MRGHPECLVDGAMPLVGIDIAPLNINGGDLLWCKAAWEADLRAAAMECRIKVVTAYKAIGVGLAY